MNSSESLLILASMKRLSLVAGCVFLLGASTGYHLIKKVPLGAAPGGGEYFDYINFDAASRRVYLSHGTEVRVLDGDTGASLSGTGLS